ncbi:MAG: aldo/keto reductase [Kiritimatiellae bacterium]|nr:aldo/keto reductase [Kiritimatiellia bacterium]
MQTRKLGQSDIEVSAVIMGSWALGGTNWGGTAKNRPTEAIHAALDAGITTIDTAPIYGFGLSEEVVGKAIKGRRSEVLLATKCGLVWDDRDALGTLFSGLKPR